MGGGGGVSGEWRSRERSDGFVGLTRDRGGRQEPAVITSCLVPHDAGEREFPTTLVPHHPRPATTPPVFTAPLSLTQHLP